MPDGQDSIESPQTNGATNEGGVSKNLKHCPFLSLTLLGTEPEWDETDLGLARPFDAALAIVILGNVLVTLGL
jgi:hypothetical protein